MSLQARPELIVPDRANTPDFGKIIGILYGRFVLKQRELTSITGIGPEMLRRLQDGRSSNPPFRTCSVLTELALSNFTIEELEDCGLI